MATNDFTGTGQSATARGKTLRYWADFTTGTGVGTVQLQYKTEDGNWIPADSAVTADMDVAKVIDFGEARREVRWNCSAYTSGTITTHLE